jgi:hypothetical protein
MPPLWRAPGAEMSKMFQSGTSGMSAVTQVEGNLILFLPLGALVPLWVRRLRSIARVLLAAMLLSVAVETAQVVASALACDRPPEGRANLSGDALLVADPEIRTTRLRWLSAGPVEASPAAVKAEVAKLEFLRGLSADALDLSVLPAERRRFLATVGRRLTSQALERRDPQRRYPILLTVLAGQSAIDVLDETVQLFDQATSARESKAERKMRDALAERGKAGRRCWTTCWPSSPTPVCPMRRSAA